MQFGHADLAHRRKIRRSHFMSDNGATLDRLESSLGSDWPAIRKARSDATAMRNRLDELFRGQNSPDTSLVVFGSVARQEVTSSSDLDWILLIDGQSIPEHKEQERVIENLLAKNEYIEPGRSGVFGKMVGVMTWFTTSAVKMT
jgi:predicted nucleotidyltransferase